MVQLLTDETYHIYNRGVEKRDIFCDTEDYRYFWHALEYFNTDNSRRMRPQRQIKQHGRSRTSPTQLITIHAACLMPNHFHIVATQNTDGGLSKFLQKLGTGFTHFFNKKYERSGAIFQGKTKKKHVVDDVYYQHLLRYVLCNPLSIKLGNDMWKRDTVVNASACMNFLKQYPWLYVRDIKLFDYIKEELHNGDVSLGEVELRPDEY